MGLCWAIKGRCHQVMLAGSNWQIAFALQLSIPCHVPVFVWKGFLLAHLNASPAITKQRGIK